MATPIYNSSQTPEDNLRRLLAEQKDGGQTAAYPNGSEPLGVLIAKAAFNLLQSVEGIPSGEVAWSDITGKPASFNPSTHASTHEAGGADPILNLGDALGVVAIDTDARTILNSAGTSIAEFSGAFSFYDTGGNTSIEVDGRTLYDAGGLAKIMWDGDIGIQAVGSGQLVTIRSDDALDMASNNGTAYLNGQQGWYLRVAGTNSIYASPSNEVTVCDSLGNPAISPFSRDLNDDLGNVTLNWGVREGYNTWYFDGLVIGPNAFTFQSETFAGIGSAVGLQGQVRYITDCITSVYYAAAAGGGAIKTKVTSDGVNWRVG